MANIKNFGLVGVGTDVQFGKSGPRLINDANVFKFKNAAGTAFVDLQANNVTADALKSEVAKLVTVDANGKLVLDANIADLATDAEVEAIRATLAAADATEKSRAEGQEAAIRGEFAAADTAINSTITALDAAYKAADLVIAGDLADHITAYTAEVADIRADFAAEDTAIRNEMQAAIAGITWENPVNQMVADVAARDALEGLATGARIYVTADNKVYTKTAEGFDAGEVMVAGAAFFDRETTVPYVFNGSSMVQFNGAAGLTAGLGLILNGNTMDLDLATTGGLKFYPDATNPNNTVGLKLDGASLTVGTSGLKLSDTLTTEITALRTDLGAEVTRATTAEGTLTTNLGAEVTRATGEEARIEGLLTAEVTRATGIEAGLQSELDATQTGAGLSTTGAYLSETTSNYINSATSLKGADFLLDAQIKQVATDLAALGSGSLTALQNEVDAMEAALGLTEAGAKSDFSSVNYILAGDTFAAAINKIDAALKAMDTAYLAADTAIRGEFAAADTALHTTVTGELNTAIAGEVSARNTAIADAIAAEVTRATNADTQVLTDANAYTDTREVSILGYVDGKVTLLTTAIATAKSEAIADANAYTDTKVAAGIANASRSVYAAFAYTDASKAIATLPAGARVHRIKVYIDTAFEGVDAVQVGTATANGELIGVADLDYTGAGVYTVELNKLYGAQTEILVYVNGTLKTAGAGAVLVEYLA